nr:p38 MAP kinase MPK2 protein [Hymenolepis microstoma]
MSERNFITHHIGGGGLCWHLPERYINLKPVSYGSFGCVCSAKDTLTNCQVAIKLLKKPFDVLELAKRTYRELAVLSHMKHENVVHLVDAFSNQKSIDEFEDLYLVMPFMPIDLARVLQNESLDDEQILLFSYQILRGLKYIHGAKILHRDLKPANIIVNEDLELQIADFGLARNVENLRDNRSYVMTRSYRAPEVLTKWLDYNETVDIWSAACIFVEMKTGTPLFNDILKVQQVRHILQVTGKPDEIMMQKISSQHSCSYIENMDVPQKSNLAEIFPWACAELLDLLARMLELDPDRRLKAAEALEHPYFQRYHDDENEEVGTPWEDPLLEEISLTEDEWKGTFLF